ncbi:hypothetical protein FPV67DRAFT_461836 [Lyophyllum atratum]|nr:hypothetical protein FPV67DRAFT_461836 [Lyophyllum atratum]
MRPVKLKRPKPPRPRKLPQTSTSETNDPPPVMDSSDVGQETAAAGGEVGQPTGPVAGNDEEGGMGGPSVVAGVDVVRGPDRDDVWAEVMYLAPRETGEDGQKLRRIADLVNMTFRREGYVVERRALKSVSFRSAIHHDVASIRELLARCLPFRLPVPIPFARFGRGTPSSSISLSDCCPFTLFRIFELSYTPFPNLKPIPTFSSSRHYP